MLAISQPRNAAKDDHQSSQAAASFANLRPESFSEFMVDHGNLLEGAIAFDDLFEGSVDGEVLPGLEMDDPEILGEFSGESETNKPSYVSVEKPEDIISGNGKEEERASKENNKEAKKSSSAKGKNKKEPKGKKKPKVDWKPELHRRFVQAVEQLGVDKAVPSRILELMGVHSLTRHNVASHLQKYRSHRKHLLAREAEAASWTKRRQMYGGTVVGGGGGAKKPWVAPSLGYPPAATPMHHHQLGALHVWGHPAVDQSAVHTWSKHIIGSPPPQLALHQQSWAAPPPPNTSYWHQHPNVNGVTPGTLIYPLVPGVLPPPPNPAIYKAEPGICVPAGQPSSHRPVDLYPSRESVDTAIADVLTKPWLPLPLGLNPPSIDGVMTELHNQGISKVPPSPSIDCVITEPHRQGISKVPPPTLCS